MKPQLTQLNAVARADINKSLSVYKKQISKLSKLVEHMDAIDAAKAYKYRPQTPANKLKLLELPGQLARGVSMLIKTNRDIITDSSLYDLRPTPEQQTRAIEQLAISNAFLQELSEEMASIGVN